VKGEGSWKSPLKCIKVSSHKMLLIIIKLKLYLKYF
jgi:hypothetical protein